MLKPILGLAVAGAVGVVLWKLLGLLLLPFIGVMLALFFTVLKFALLGLLVWFVIWLFRRMTRDSATA